MPREPDGPYGTDDPRPYDSGGDPPYGSTDWGRAPAGGWGAETYDAPARGAQHRSGYDRAGYDRGDGAGPYTGEPEYGWPPGYATAQYDRRPRYEPPWTKGNARPPRRSAQQQGRIRLAVAAAVALAVVVFLVLGFVTPGWFVTRVFAAEAVQSGVARILTDDYAVGAVADVRCPAGVQVTTGATFTCDATIDGDPVTVPITVTDADGGYQVGRPT